MQSFFDRVQRATVEEEALRAVLLVLPLNKRSSFRVTQSIPERIVRFYPFEPWFIIFWSFDGELYE